MSKKFAYFKKKQYFCGQFLKRDSNMPKQAGTYKVRGKMDNRSYYKPKNSKDYLHRSINQQMSERVKTDPNFAITRAYANEFSAAINCSSIAMKLISDRSDLMNKAFRSSQLTKFFTNSQHTSVSGDLGHRGWNNMLWQRDLRHELNLFCKNQNLAMYNDAWNIIIEDRVVSGYTKTFFSATLNSYLFDDNALKSAGIFKYVIEFYVCKFRAARYNAELGSYLTAEDFTTKIDEYEHEVGDSYAYANIQASVSNVLGSYDDNGVMVCPLMVFSAYKKFGSSLVKIRSLSAYKFAEVVNTPQVITGVNYNGSFYPSNGVPPEFNISQDNHVELVVEPWNMDEETVSSVNINSMPVTNITKTPRGVRVELSAVFDGYQLLFANIYTANRNLHVEFGY